MSLTEKSSAVSLGYGSEESLPDIDRFQVCPQSFIYANKDIHLKKINFYGFDMDYTVCEYRSPEFDILAFDLAKEFLVNTLKYSSQILSLEYNPDFPRRGLWYDKEKGNLLKVDQFGKILICCHGFQYMQGDQLRGMYPNKIQRLDSERIYVMNTLFNLAETHLIASLTHFMDNRSDGKVVEGGWLLGPQTQLVTYRQLYQDVREAIENLHEEKVLKIKTIENMEKYVHKDSRLRDLLLRIRESGRKTFLLTNSDWWYTSHIMRFLLGNGSDQDENWLRYFDLCVVDARKPKFFTTGSTLQYVNIHTGDLEATDGSCLQVPAVYSGGDHVTISRLLGASGPDVIYCGDHLHADVVKCRKLCEWRTLLIVPELLHEVGVSREVESVLTELHHLQLLLDSGEEEAEADIKSRIWDGVKKLDRSFGVTGSIFRAGTRLSYFGSQVMIWSDLYTGSVNNLYSYELTHRFRGPVATLPHEVTRRPAPVFDLGATD